MDHMTLQASPLPAVADVLPRCVPVTVAVPTLRPWKARSRLKPASLGLGSGWMILDSSWERDSFPPTVLRRLASLGF